MVKNTGFNVKYLLGSWYGQSRKLCIKI